MISGLFEGSLVWPRLGKGSVGALGLGDIMVPIARLRRWAGSAPPTHTPGDGAVGAIGRAVFFKGPYKGPKGL